MTLQTAARRLLTEAAAGVAAVDPAKPLGAGILSVIGSLRGAVSGLASLDNTGRLPSGQLPTSYLDDRYLNLSELGVPNGAASLTAQGRLPTGQMPIEVQQITRAPKYTTVASKTQSLPVGTTLWAEVDLAPGAIGNSTPFQVLVVAVAGWQTGGVGVTGVCKLYDGLQELPASPGAYVGPFTGSVLKARLYLTNGSSSSTSWTSGLNVTHQIWPV